MTSHQQRKEEASAQFFFTRNKENKIWTTDRIQMMAKLFHRQTKQILTKYCCLHHQDVWMSNCGMTVLMLSYKQLIEDGLIWNSNHKQNININKVNCWDKTHSDKMGYMLMKMSSLISMKLKIIKGNEKYHYITKIYFITNNFKNK